MDSHRRRWVKQRKFLLRTMNLVHLRKRLATASDYRQLDQHYKETNPSYARCTLGKRCQIPGECHRILLKIHTFSPQSAREMHWSVRAGAFLPICEGLVRRARWHHARLRFEKRVISSIPVKWTRARPQTDSCSLWPYWLIAPLPWYFHGGWSLSLTIVLATEINVRSFFLVYYADHDFIGEKWRK